MNNVFLYMYILANVVHLSFNIPRLVNAIKHKHLGIGNKHLTSEAMQLIARIPMFLYQVNIGATAIYIACFIDIMFNCALLFVNVSSRHYNTEPKV